MRPRLLHEIVRLGAARTPDRRAHTFVTDAGEKVLTYAGLDERARALAAVLQARGLHGERVLLLFRARGPSDTRTSTSIVRARWMDRDRREPTFACRSSARRASMKQRVRSLVSSERLRRVAGHVQGDRAFRPWFALAVVALQRESAPHAQRFDPRGQL